MGKDGEPKTSLLKTPVRENDFVVIGAGPVGLLSAILLAKELKDAKITVYEARDSLITKLEESYPIGLNPRGVQALDRANRDMAITIRTKGFMVDGWRIFAGTRQVAELPSGLVIGTTRSIINQTLYEEVRRHYGKQIEIKWSHRLKDVDTFHRQLVFEHQGQDVRVDGGGARVIACDGVWSIMRAQAEKQCEGFRSDITPWGVQFRLLFSKPGAIAAGLDSRYHYVLNGIYTSIIQGDVWVMAIGIKDTDPPEVKELLTAKEATPARIAALRAYVAKTAPLASPFLTDDDLGLYFSRKCFRGAMVKVNRLNIGEWAVLLGDAAHSAIPPTGEGFNSGAEDVEVLLEALAETPNAPFAAYSEMRLPDVHALHDLAYDLNLSNFTSGPEKIARLMTMIITSICKSCQIYRRTYEDLTFGVDSSPPQPYRDIVNMWQRQRFLILPISRLLAYPIFLVYWILAFLVSVFRTSNQNMAG